MPGIEKPITSHQELKIQALKIKAHRRFVPKRTGSVSLRWNGACSLLGKAALGLWDHQPGARGNAASQARPGTGPQNLHIKPEGRVGWDLPSAGCRRWLSFPSAFSVRGNRTAPGPRILSTNPRQSQRHRIGEQAPSGRGIPSSFPSRLI